MNNVTTNILQDTAKNIIKNILKMDLGMEQVDIVIVYGKAIAIAIYYIIKLLKNADDREISKISKMNCLQCFKIHQLSNMKKCIDEWNVIAEIKEISQKVQVDR